MRKFRKVSSIILIILIAIEGFISTGACHPSLAIRVPLIKSNDERAQIFTFEHFLSLTESKLTQNEASLFLSEKKKNNEDILFLDRVIEKRKPTITFKSRPAAQIPGKAITPSHISSDNWYDIYKLKNMLFLVPYWKSLTNLSQNQASKCPCTKIS